LQQGINLSPSTCGRILALNRKLYHLQMPVKRGRPKKEMPFKAERRHQYWTTDIRYLDMHQLGGGMIYCISILENFSRGVTRNSSRTLSEAKEEMPLVRFRSSPKDLMATGVAFG